MTMMKNITILLALLAGGCVNLDSFLFVPEEATEYALDAWDGDAEYPELIDSLGPVDMNSVHPVIAPVGNEAVHGILLAADTSFARDDTVIAFFHGQKGTIDYSWPRIRLMHQTGYPVMAIDYRGFGKSAGTPSEQHLYEDGAAAMEWLRDHGDPRVVVYAYSMGSLVGCDVARQDTSGCVIALVLEGPIGSIQTIVDDGTSLTIPGSYLTTYKGNNAEKIRDIEVPFFWLHGAEDGRLRMETNGMAVWQNYRGVRGCRIIAEGAGHSTIPSTMGFTSYVEAIQGFIRGMTPDYIGTECSR
jgi:hypothetical protein